jgi:hypothetical protein
MHGNIYVATSPHRYKGIYNVYMADIYEGMDIGVYTTSKIGMCVCVCVYIYIYIYVCVCVCVCVCACVCLYKQYNSHVCIHLHV